MALNLGQLDGTIGFRISGADAQAWIGWSVSTAGDVNGDGIDDVIIAAPGNLHYDGLASASYVVFGSTVGFESDVDLAALDGTNGFRLDGANPGDHSGISVAGAGDVNGDGVDDLIVGSPESDPLGGGGTHTGGGYIVFGATGGFAASTNLSSLDGTNGFRLDGIEAGDDCGNSVAGVGDVNGDGIGDIVIGAPRADSEIGEAYVVFGSATDFAASMDLSALDGDNGFRLTGVGEFDFTGGGTAGADLNGDGFDDVVVSAWYADPDGVQDAGVTYVVFGSSTGFAPNIDASDLNGSNGFRILGTNAYEKSGTRIDNAGDINGDGIEDLIIGAPSQFHYGTGVSYVVFGTSSGFDADLLLASLDGTNGFRIDGIDAYDRSGGGGVAGAGDVNGDGIDDLVIGAQLADPDGKQESGECYVIFGNSDGFGASIHLSNLNGSNGFRVDGLDAGNEITSVAGAGDLNGDGIDDIVVGSVYADPNGNENAGESYVIFGSTLLGGANDGPLAADDTLEASSLDIVDLGADHGSGADHDPDFDDLTITAIEGVAIGAGGSVKLASGLRVTLVGGTDVRLDAPGAALGTFSSSFTYEVSDGRGSPDTASVVVSFSKNALVATDVAGALDLAHLDGTNGFRLVGAEAYDLAGLSVARAGDVNGDGLADIVVGAPGAGLDGSYGSGEAYVVFGTDEGFPEALDLAGLDGTTGFRLQGFEEGDQSGSAVAGAGDINGDGIDDLIIGAPASDRGGPYNILYNTGQSYVVFGTDEGFAASLEPAQLDGSNGFRMDGSDEGDGSGVAVAAAGDINGDGLGDLIVGASGADPDRTGGAGESYVVFGRTSGFAASLELADLDGTEGFRLDGEDASDGSGQTVAAAGDVNGDGLDDLIVGPPGAGVSYVLFGSLGGFEPTVDLGALDGSGGFRIVGGATSVAGAGDVNGDGLDDLVIGAANVGDTGAAYVVFGTRTGFGAGIDLAGVDGTNGFRIEGAVVRSEFGASVAGAGDVNGDGFGDLIVGAPARYGVDDYTEGESASYIILGSSTGFAATVDGTAGFRLLGVEAGDRSGTSVSAAGDLNGDGIDDLVVGAPNAGESGTGEGYVIFGSAEIGGANVAPVAADDTLLAVPLGVVDLAADNGAGADHDADLDPLTIVAIDGNPVVAGDTLVLANGMEVTFLGGTELRVGNAPDLRPGESLLDRLDYTLTDGRGGTATASAAIELRQNVFDVAAIDGTNGIRLDGAAPGDYSGHDVAGVGDIDGDGIDDLVVAAYGAGASYVVFGSDAGLPAATDLGSLDGTDGFRLDGAGYAAGAAGDINGDGIDDLFANGNVLFGTDGGFPASRDVADLDGTDGFRLDFGYGNYATALAGAGDVNGDGIDDLMIGAFTFSYDGSEGGAYILFGTSDGFDADVGLATLDGTTGFHIGGIGTYEAEGLSVDVAGDLNGDGFDDMVIGVPREYANGEAYVVFGSGSASDISVGELDGSNGFLIDSDFTGGFTGTSVAGAGDVNGDGLDDLIIGAPNWYGDGISYVVFGSTDDFQAVLDVRDLDGSNGFRLSGSDDGSGFSVDGAGDFNGDGVGDLIVGSYYLDRTYVVFGSDAGFEANVDLADLSGDDGFRLDGVDGPVAGAGDVNHDGFDDLMVSSPDANEGAGASYVIFGFAPGPPDQPPDEARSLPPASLEMGEHGGPDWLM